MKTIKFINFAVSNQIAMIWNDINAEFQKDIYKLNEATILNDFLNALNEFKNIWWQFARRRMFFSVFKNFNYRADQYQQSDEKFKFYENISESSEKYRNFFSL